MAQRPSSKDETASILHERSLIGFEHLDSDFRPIADLAYMCHSTQLKCLVLHVLDYKQIKQKFYKQETL